MWATSALARLADVRRPAAAERGGRSDGARRHDRADGAGRPRLRRASRRSTCRAGTAPRRPLISEARAARRRRPQRARRRRGRARVRPAGRRGPAAPQLHRLAEGRSRLPAAARDGLARRPARVLRTSRRRAQYLDGVVRSGGDSRRRRRRHERRAAARPQPDVGHSRRGRRLPARARTVGLSADRRSALPAGDADSAASGRYFDDRDVASSANVIIINENLAHALWPGRDPSAG